MPGSPKVFRVVGRIPPPLIVIVPFFLGHWIQNAIGGIGVLGPLSRLVGFLGFLFIAGGLALVVTSIVLFARRRTTLVPHGSSRALVLSGPYKFTRNPVYLGLIAVYIGSALVFHELFAMLLLPLPWWVMDRLVIPGEERQLESAFGESYCVYKRQVRRWFGKKRPSLV
ncbi:MAG: isoprenylcysteine carboxylmethyltransferase family protein [Pseudomonadota bacterium]